MCAMTYQTPPIPHHPSTVTSRDAIGAPLHAPLRPAIPHCGLSRGTRDTVPRRRAQAVSPPGATSTCHTCHPSHLMARPSHSALACWHPPPSCCPSCLLKVSTLDHDHIGSHHSVSGAASTAAVAPLVPPSVASFLAVAPPACFLFLQLSGHVHKLLIVCSYLSHVAA